LLNPRSTHHPFVPRLFQKAGHSARSRIEIFTAAVSVAHQATPLNHSRNMNRIINGSSHAAESAAQAQ
jgi:hypothetical protein